MQIKKKSRSQLYSMSENQDQNSTKIEFPSKEESSTKIEFPSKEENKTAIVLDEYADSASTHSYHGTAWYDKKLIPGIPSYSSGLIQVVLLSFVAFLCPGCFNALSGLGGAGLSSATLANKANIALNSTFSVVGFFSGTFVNTFGVKPSLIFGGSGYCIYVLAFLLHKVCNKSDAQITAVNGFIVFAGAWLGVCAGMFWCAQGAIMMSYPTEKAKGRYVFMFWTIFNLGAVIGSCVPLGQNMHNENGSSVGTGTYVAFLVLTACGFILAIFLLPIKKVKRKDGSKIITPKNPKIKEEMSELFKVMKREPWIVGLFPLFFSSNWFYTYEQSDFNTTNFNIRTRALNSLLFWLMQMFGAMVIGCLLDFKKLSRKRRALYGWAVVFGATHIIWGCGYIFAKDHYRGAVVLNPIDFTERRYIGPMFLYMFYGFFDALWQCYSYWIMGALTNSSRKCAIYTGYYKGLQSAGAAISWAIDNMNKPYQTMFGTSWGLLAGSMVIAFPVLFYKVEETTDINKDLVGISADSPTYDDVSEYQTHVSVIDEA
ncbi:related to DUF895 domain membrane protein [Saccharomycodes ludwigii]|uniref:Related to DUF895 domain membrane protein n=1 Tax=Saccharomycodes ludwigii TaxID=36035 RepID=A0A376BC15_9ASCO|nr:hypothetical protein SCDLUD_002239 [Saccharomycodes ludwigii]KAH3902417.1 hypothetical protein SCDLUD_002239 [Saccharomycodes ludwigii]SSD62131.1 related to DUF895 domain membrane protein [Saccharomycodes ludwigii]